MTSEEYGQYIDDFELGADVMPGESLTDYIERRRREFEFKSGRRIDWYRSFIYRKKKR